jgi:hypothetical protein
MKNLSLFCLYRLLKRKPGDISRYNALIRQWPEEKVHKDKQRSTKHAHKTNDPVTRTPHKTGVNSGAPEG